MAPNGLLVLYGSETGNAQDVAERVGREGKRRHYKVRVVRMDAYNVAQLPTEPAVVFVTSTTGQGELPKNMRQFWRFLLRKSLPPDSLAAVSFAVFGLGDSGYLKYNVAAKKLDRRLAALGAAAVLERGLGDDQHPSGFDAALDPWLRSLWEQLRLRFPLPLGLSDPDPGDTSTSLEPKFHVTFLPATTSNGGDCESAATAAPANELEEAVAAARAFHSLDPAGTGVDSLANTIGSGLASGGGTRYGPWRPYMAAVAGNTRITTASHFQDVRHVELDLGDSGLVYEPGDLVAIFPQQSQAAVQQFLVRVGLDPNARVRVELAEQPANSQAARSIEVRVGALVNGVLDINGASPRRFFFEVLKHFASTDLEVERLEYFSTPEGRDDLYRYNQREDRTVLEVLQDFKSASPSLEWLLQTVPHLQPRYFSIASSLHGSVPLILIGPGTGVAPFRAFLEEREQLAKQGQAMAPAHLYFGCRSEHGDYYYRSDWERMQQAGILAAEAGLVTAFSRDQPRKVYVQHRIRENGALIWQLLQQGGMVYVSGSAAKMPQDVARALADVVCEHGRLPQQDAAEYVRKLELSRRYFVEAWS
ncbi:hypothetical protein WJX72_004073 [[Myrmecia] bisecta]|uniref:NADPH-dependent FMN and FAD-containing oxidoreductase n=1 Tax=[Myrmecia] bisecta TaxID=41462 RepID=A0AAW1QQ42_9CHLO